MAESSDEEKSVSDKKDGNLSPRTMLAIQEALAEEEDSSSDQSRQLHGSPPKQQITVRQPAPQVVVVSSSEDEADLSALTILPGENPNAEKKSSGQSVYVKDGLLVSSSEDEMEEVIAERNKALRTTLPEEVEVKEEKNKEVGDERRTESGKQEEPQTRATLNGDLARRHGEAAPHVKDLPISTSAQVCVKPFTADTENGSAESEQKTKETNEVKLVASGDSESEGTTVLD